MSKVTNQEHNLTNAEFSALVAKENKAWADFTAEGTLDVFNEKGFESAITPMEGGVLPINEFTNTIVRITLNKINIANVKDLLSDFVEVYETPVGGITQRMAIDPIDPISPQFKNLSQFSINSPFVHRKPDTRERFFKQNFDFQNVISIQRFQLKQAFLDEYGMGNWVSGVMEQLSNSWTKQRALNRLQALHTGLNSVALKPSQKVNVNLSQAPTDAELRTLIKQIKDTINKMVVTIDTNEFNSYGLSKSLNKDDYVLLVRPELISSLETTTLYSAFNKEMLDTGVKTILLPNFGGLIPQKDGQDLTLQYDEWGIATNKNEVNGYRDPNANVLCAIAQKGIIWESYQDTFTIEPSPYNPRTKETTFWANAVNNGVYYDSAYDLVKFEKTTSNKKEENKEEENK